MVRKYCKYQSEINTCKNFQLTRQRNRKSIVIDKQYGLTLKSFFKDYFKYWDDCYLIPFYDIQLFKKQCFDFIKSSCNDD